MWAKNMDSEHKKIQKLWSGQRNTEKSNKVRQEDGYVTKIQQTIPYVSFDLTKLNVNGQYIWLRERQVVKKMCIRDRF